MLKSRALASALVVGSITVASVFAAAPAHAATLPNGQRITVVDYFEWQFSEANPETAVLTPVGTAGVSDGANLTAVDVNDDGHGFAFSTYYEEIIPEPCDPEVDPECVPEFPTYVADGAALHTADANTGTLGAGTPVQIVTGPADEPILADADECLALDYSGGVLLGACNIYGDGDSAWVGAIDPATAILTPQLLLYGEDFIQFLALALDPISGSLYGFDVEGRVWLVTLDNTFPSELGTAEMAVYAADFDRGGQLWVSALRPGPVPARAIEPGEEGLATLDLNSGEFPFNSVWTPETATVHALSVWGKETLAVTGVAQSPAVWVGATVFLLFGSILAAGAMMVRRRSAES